jgi:hypothetical protein
MALDGSRHMNVYVRLLIDAKPCEGLRNSMSLVRKVRMMASACGASTSAVSSGVWSYAQGPAAAVKAFNERLKF